MAVDEEKALGISSLINGMVKLREVKEEKHNHHNKIEDGRKRDRVRIPTAIQK